MLVKRQYSDEMWMKPLEFQSFLTAHFWEMKIDNKSTKNIKRKATKCSCVDIIIKHISFQTLHEAIQSILQANSEEWRWIEPSLNKIIRFYFINTRKSNKQIKREEQRTDNHLATLVSKIKTKNKKIVIRLNSRKLWYQLCVLQNNVDLSRNHWKNAFTLTSKIKGQDNFWGHKNSSPQNFSTALEYYISYSIDWKAIIKLEQINC